MKCSRSPGIQIVMKLRKKLSLIDFLDLSIIIWLINIKYHLYKKKLK